MGTEILVNTATAGAQISPGSFGAVDGGFVVTWRDASHGVGGPLGPDTSGRAVKAQVFAAGGAKVGDEILVNTATMDGQDEGQVTTLMNGNFVVTWRDASHGVGGAGGDADGYAVKAQVFTAGGAKIGSEILVNTATANDQGFQHITALSDGGFVVTWRDVSLGVGGAGGDTDGDAVKAQVFAAGGTKVGGEILINTATAEDQNSRADHGAVERRLRGDVE